MKNIIKTTKEKKLQEIILWTTLCVNIIHTVSAVISLINYIQYNNEKE